MLACFALLGSVCPLTHSFSYSRHLWCLSDQTSKHIHTYIYIHTPYIHVPCCPPRAFPLSLRALSFFSLFLSPPAVVLSCLFLFPIHSLVRFFLLPFLPSFCPLRLPLPSHLHFSCFCLLGPSQLGVALSFALSARVPFFLSALPPDTSSFFYPLAKE